MESVSDRVSHPEGTPAIAGSTSGSLSICNRSPDFCRQIYELLFWSVLHKQGNFSARMGIYGFIHLGAILIDLKLEGHKDRSRV